MQLGHAPVHNRDWTGLDLRGSLKATRPQCIALANILPLSLLEVCLLAYSACITSKITFNDVFMTFQPLAEGIIPLIHH